MVEDRRDDWHNSVDERLVNLNSAQGSTDVELAKMDEELSKIDGILRGDSEGDGLIADLHAMGKEIRKFNGLLEYDSAGNPGLLKKIDAVLEDRERAEKRIGYRWTFWTAFLPVVVVQFLILIGLLVVNWDKIQEYVTLHEHIHQAASIESHTKKLKAKRKKPKPVPVIQEPEPVESEDVN